MDRCVKLSSQGAMAESCCQLWGRSSRNAHWQGIGELSSGSYLCTFKPGTVKNMHAFKVTLRKPAHGNSRKHIFLWVKEFHMNFVFHIKSFFYRTETLKQSTCIDLILYFNFLFTKSMESFLKLWLYLFPTFTHHLYISLNGRSMS